MKEILINRQNEGTKLLRMLAKLLPGAGQNFIYKMLRKKNITLNDKKATGNELLKDGDNIKVFFSDETYAKFSGNSGNGRSGADSDASGEEKRRVENNSEYLKNDGSCRSGSLRLTEEQIIYEDDDMILCNKPAGVLSQKAEQDDVSMVELIAGYLESKGEYDPADAVGFKPAVANRLDRNTSGIIAAGKSVSGLKFLSDGFKCREFEKLYLCVVKGELKESVLLNGLWNKSGHGNKVSIRSVGEKFFDKKRILTGTLRQAQGTQNKAQGTQNEAQGTQNKVHGTQNKAQGTQNKAQGTQNKAQGTQNKAQGTQNKVHGTQNKVHGTLSLSKGTKSSYKENPTDSTGFPREYFVKGNIPVQTYAEPVISNGKATLCLVKLMTGKTHQIRAQLSEAGYPLLGDHKYGDRSFNSFYKDVYRTEFQLLHAYMLVIPDKGVFFADIPCCFEDLLRGEGLWVEDLRERIINS